MIIETVFSTLDPDGTPNFAPMGIGLDPMGVGRGAETVWIRPFCQTRTYQNLVSRGCGVANLTDDVLAFVQSGLYHAALPHFPAVAIPGAVLAGTASWLELVVTGENSRAVSQAGERAEVQARIVHTGRQRELMGFCRARAAVLEAAILATRLHLTAPEEVFRALDGYEQIVAKTGDESEILAMGLVREYIRRQLNDD